VETPIRKSDNELFADRLTLNKNSAIKFSSEDARYMTARMISTLDYVVDKLPRGFSLMVLDGYRDIEKDNISFPLQYEGTRDATSYVIITHASRDTSDACCIEL